MYRRASCGWRRNEARPLVRISHLCSLHYGRPM